MPRSASDATRFTATGPYAAAKPTASSISIGGPVPANETSAQKIARLRAAAARARAGQESKWDKVVISGRRWADRAHRFTAISLISITILCFFTASFATGDMIMHNRRKRGEWLAQQQAKSARDLEEARRAAATGIATDDQILLLNREKAAADAEASRKSQKGIFARAKESVLGGEQPEEEQKGGKIGAAARAAQEKAQETFEGQSQRLGVVQAVEDKLEETRAKIDQKTRTGEVLEGVLHPRGGPLDREAAAALSGVTSKTNGWMTWITGR